MQGLGSNITPLQDAGPRFDEPVQIDARLVPLPYSPLSQHLFHDFFIAGDSVAGENVKPAQHQHAEGGPHRQLAPVASLQHLLPLLSVARLKPTGARTSKPVRKKRSLVSKLVSPSAANPPSHPTDKGGV